MKDIILNNLQMRFPFIMKEAVECRELDRDEVLVTLNDGNRFLYDDMGGTIRKLPADSGEMSEDECRTEFGLRLYKLMYCKGLTQEDLSELTGIQRTQLSNYITGKTTPSFYIVDKIAKALECSTDDLRYL